MTLQDLMDQLNTGELSLMRFGGETEEGITEGNMQRLVPHVNLGLTALHRRFRLREARHKVTLEPGRESYRLTASEGQGGVLQIERVLWPEGLSESLPRAEHRQVSPDLPLDAEGDPLSVFRTTMTTLRVPESLQDLGVTELEVVVRQDHPRIVWDEGFFYPEEIEVDVPATHIEALGLFVASRMFNPLGSAGGATDFHEGNNYAQKYERACQQLEQWGYQVKGQAEQTRFERNGFV